MSETYIKEKCLSPRTIGMSHLHTRLLISKALPAILHYLL